MEQEVTSIMYAAHAGALSTLQRYKLAGMDLSLCNYDRRTALHVAASEGKLKVVEMLLDSPEVSINSVDRCAPTCTTRCIYSIYALDWYWINL